MKQILLLLSTTFFKVVSLAQDASHEAEFPPDADDASSSVLNSPWLWGGIIVLIIFLLAMIDRASRHRTTRHRRF